MKKDKILAAAMTSIMVTGMLSGCVYDPVDNISPELYGSPSVRVHSGKEVHPPEFDDPDVQSIYEEAPVTEDNENE